MTIGLLAVEAGSGDPLGSQCPEVRETQQDQHEDGQALDDGVVLCNGRQGDFQRTSYICADNGWSGRLGGHRSWRRRGRGLGGSTCGGFRGHLRLDVPLDTCIRGCYRQQHLWRRYDWSDRLDHSRGGRFGDWRSDWSGLDGRLNGCRRSLRLQRSQSRGWVNYGRDDNWGHHRLRGRSRFNRLPSFFPGTRLCIGGDSRLGAKEPENGQYQDHKCGLNTFDSGAQLSPRCMFQNAVRRYFERSHLSLGGARTSTIGGRPGLVYRMD